MMSWQARIQAIALLELLTIVGFLMGAPRWLAVLYAALGIALAVDSARLARPRRGRELGRASATPASSARTLADRRASGPAVAPGGSAFAGWRAGGALAPAGARPDERVALGYVYVAANGPDFAAQSKTVKGWCAESALTLTTIVHDVEVQPGDAGARPALGWALERIAAGEAQTLVVARLRHLSTSVADLPPLLRWFTEPQRTLVAIDLKLDTATEAGRLAAFALAGVGGWEHERLSARTRQGLEAARSRGSGRGRAAVADVPELRERIVHMRERGLTLQAIADALNKEGVPTLRGGAEWRPSSVQRATGYQRPASQRGVALPPVLPEDGAERG